MIEDYDVVVAGSGGGGLVGALRAAENGLRVLVLEKADVCGGTTALSGAGLWAPANHLVLNAGQDDDLDKAQVYMDATVGDRTPRSMQQAYLHAARDTIAWLEGKDVRFSFMTGYPDYHPSEPGALLTGRAITPKSIRRRELVHRVQPKLPLGDGGPPIPDVGPDGPIWGGQSLITQLLTACEGAGVTVWTGCAFEGLLTDGGRVVGVRTADGREIAAPAGVLLATGGFEHDVAMRASYQDEVLHHDGWTLGVPGNTGDGIQAGMELGAATDLLEDCWWAPGLLRGDGKPSFLLFERAAPTGIIVDQQGKRWVNEGTPYNTFGHLMLQARDRGVPCIPSWYVLDSRALETYGFGGLRPGADVRPWLEDGTLIAADTVEDLAEKLDAPGLPEQVKRWNGFCEKGVDEELDRGAEGSYERQLLWVFQRYPGIAGPHEWPNPSNAPLTQGPFYAGKVVLSDLGTKGGLVCDEHGRVTRPDGSAIDGLYACGNAMASVFGHSYPGPGACITPAMAFGWLAADDMKAGQ
ncbi:MAG: kstD1 [Frankiales bacterium]|nr:kstD1 [Frankiales bacterium]